MWSIRFVQWLQDLESLLPKNRFVSYLLTELGTDSLRYKEEWEKEEKQNLMHVAVCRLFMEDGYYKFVGKDQDGWPHYELLKAIPNIHLKDQEGLLKEKIVAYFKEMKYID